MRPGMSNREIMLSYRERVGGTAMRGEKPYVYRYSKIRDEPEAPEEQQACQLDEAQRKIAALRHRVQSLERRAQVACCVLSTATPDRKPR